MNYTEAYKRYELKPLHPELNQSPGQGRSGRKAFAVHKNMQSSGLGPGADYYLQRYQPFIGDSKPADLGTFSSPQFRRNDKPPPPADIPQTFDPSSRPEHSYSQPPTRYNPDYEAKPAEPDTYDAAKLPPRQAQVDPTYRQGPDARYDPAPADLGYRQAPNPRYDPSPADNGYRQGSDPRNDPAPADPVYDEKLAELLRLQEQLRKREEEVEKYRRVKQSVSQSPPKPPQQDNSESFDRINKSLWDKQVTAEHRKMNVQALEYQLNEKQMKQQWVTLQREQEQMQRLEHLKRLREVETQERMNQLSRAQQYRQHLDIQRQLKQELSTQDKLRSQAVPPEESAPPRHSQDPRNSYEPKTEYERVAMQFYEQPSDAPSASSLTPFRLTKKAPKTISYNPITGIVRDTSLYLQGDVPRPVLKSYLPEPRNQDRVVPEFSHLPAFQQPLYTAKNPKVISTDPISMKLPKKDYQTAQYYQDAAKFFGVDEEEETKPGGSRMADYGAMVLQSPVIPKGSGYNYKDTRHLVQ